jgi:HEAT repeat protein
MEDPEPRLAANLNTGDAEPVAAAAARLDAADTEARKQALRAARDAVEEGARPDEAAVGQLTSFLTDDDRAVRLTTAKLFVALARSVPGAVVPADDALAARLADEAEFYYARARCAEALGYVAVESPATVADPEMLADLRIGLEFDEPEVKEKLAKALAHVALGDPGRLRHHVDSLGEHLDAAAELVRYHLCTALVAIGCEHPERLADAEDALRERLRDESAYVRGRAAEALGLLAGVGVEGLCERIDAGGALDGVDTEATPAFLVDRVEFCRRRLADRAVDPMPGVGTVEAVRDGTADAVAAMRAPDDGVCPHCGLDFPDDGPPMCPRCGTPR